MGKYDKIINMPHHTSSNRIRMSLLDRAAQFAPFAALTGYEESIKEVARLTDKKIELTDEEFEIINSKIKYIIENKIQEEIEIIYFVPDEKKDGGCYYTYKGLIKKVDEFNKAIILENREQIKISDIVSFNSDILEFLYNENGI